MVVYCKILDPCNCQQLAVLNTIAKVVFKNKFSFNKHTFILLTTGNDSIGIACSHSSKILNFYALIKKIT